MRVKYHSTTAMTMLGTPSHFVVYQYLLDCVDKNHPFDTIHVTHDEIAQHCCMDKRNVIIALSDLERAKLLLVIRGPLWTNDYYAIHYNHYRALLSAFEKLEPSKYDMFRFAMYNYDADTLNLFGVRSNGRKLLCTNNYIARHHALQYTLH